MLDRLPPELVLRILRFVAPLKVGDGWSGMSPSDRRATLRSLPLVSKQLCIFAQPMLPEVVEVTRDEHVDWLGTIAGGPTVGHQVKVLRIEVERYYGPDGEEEPRRPDARAALAVCPNLVDLTLCNLSELELEWLKKVPALERLVVRSYFEDEWSSTTTLAPETPGLLSLVELDICGTSVSSNFFEFFPSSAPNLRTLAASSDGPCGPLPVTLIQQLELLRLDLPDEGASLPNWAADAPILFRCSLQHSPPELMLRHSAIQLHYFLEDLEPSAERDREIRSVIEGLFGLCSAMAGDYSRAYPSAGLDFISLPNSLHKSRNRNFASAVRALLDVAEANEVEVTFDDDGDGLSPGFRRYVRNIKVKYGSWARRDRIWRGYGDC